MGGTCSHSVPGSSERTALAFSCTKDYPGQVKRHSLPFQVEAALKYLVVPLTFAHDCKYIHTDKLLVLTLA